MAYECEKVNNKKTFKSNWKRKREKESFFCDFFFLFFFLLFSPFFPFLPFRVRFHLRRYKIKVFSSILEEEKKKSEFRSKSEIRWNFYCSGRFPMFFLFQFCSLTESTSKKKSKIEFGSHALVSCFDNTKQNNFRILRNWHKNRETRLVFISFFRVLSFSLLIFLFYWNLFLLLFFFCVLNCDSYFSHILNFKPFLPRCGLKTKSLSHGVRFKLVIDVFCIVQTMKSLQTFIIILYNNNHFPISFVSLFGPKIVYGAFAEFVNAI